MREFDTDAELFLKSAGLRCQDSYWAVVLQSDALHPEHTFEETLEAALKGGVTIVQLREKKADTRDFLKLAQLAKTKCAQVSIRPWWTGGAVRLTFRTTLVNSIKCLS